MKVSTDVLHQHAFELLVISRQWLIWFVVTKIKVISGMESKVSLGLYLLDKVPDLKFIEVVVVEVQMH